MKEKIKKAWEAIKRWFLVAASYIKKYWWILVLGAASVWALVFSKNKTQLLEQFIKERETLNQRHQEEIDALNRIHQNDLTQRARIEQEYRTTIDRINQSHAEAIENLTKAKRQELRAIIAETNNNPELMTERVNNLFGFNVLTLPSS